jgi:hypothetical protein
VTPVLNRALQGAVAVAAAAAAVAAPAWAEPTTPAPPAPPNVLALPPASPVGFTTADGVYAFTAPVGVTCVLSKGTRSYGCSGTLPGAPEGANVVTAGASGEPGFSHADRPLYQFETPPDELAEGTRLGMGTVSCGAIGGGVVCINTFDQTGFVVSPAGTYSFGGINPLLDRPEGTNPYMN